MNLDDLPPAETMCEGRFVRLRRRGKWEYASRTNNISAVVILAEYEGQVILVAVEGQACERLAQRGVLAKDTHGSTIRLAPPLVISEEQLDEVLAEILERAIASVA